MTCTVLILKKKSWKFFHNSSSLSLFNTLRPRQNGRHFADDTFKRIFLNENVRILMKISLTFVPKAPINNIPALVQMMAWRPPGDKPLSEPMMISLVMHICVTRPQWVNGNYYSHYNTVKYNIFHKALQWLALYWYEKKKKNSWIFFHNSSPLPLFKHWYWHSSALKHQHWHASASFHLFVYTGTWLTLKLHGI